MALRWRGLALAGLTLVLATVWAPAAVVAGRTKPAKTSAPAANDVAWTEFGHDDQSTKQVVSSRITTKTVGSLQERWTVPLEGEVVAEPLYYGGVVYAASEGGDVVAIDAQTGTPLWEQTTPTVDTAACGTWGISSTPVIDPASNRIYAAAADGQLYAFDLDTGGLQPGFPFPVVRGRTTGYVWGALRLLGSTVLAGVSSHCDEPNAGGAYVTGRLAAYDVASDPGSETASFQTVPAARHLGGIWGYSGATISTDGRSVYTGVGNAAGTDPACSCEHDDWGYGDSMVELSASLAVVGSNDPGIPAAGGTDDDWGAAPALFTPRGCQPLAAASNKDGYLYAYKQNALGAGPVWQVGIGTGEPPLLDGPAWSPATNMFYAAGARMPFDRNKPATGVGIVAVKVTAGCKFSVAWTKQTGTGDGDGGSQSPPIVVGGVVFASGGNSDVVALDAQTGKKLWQGQTSGDTLAAPSEAAGMLFTPDGANVDAWSPQP